MSQGVRWGFWGAGAVAQRVAQDMRLVSGARIVAVASRTIESARAFAATHGIARVHANLHALINDSEIDVVYVATPHHRHAEDAIACLRAGKAVLCEKPFALHELQAREIVAEARRANRFCMEAMWTRFIPTVQAASEMLKAGVIGRIRMVAGDFAYPVEFEPSSRLFAADMGGGALLDRGVYLVSLTQSLLGEPTTVHANAQLATTGVDAHSAYQMQYADGATAQLWAGLTVRGSNGFVIVGERGRICLHEPFYSAHRFSVTHHEPARVVPLDSGVSGSRLAALLKRAAVHHGLIRRVDWLRSARHHLGSRSMPFPGNGYQFQLAEVVRCLGAGQVESPVMPLADSQAVARTMDRLRACWTVSGDPLARAR